MIRVRAIRMGFFEGARRRTGDVFDIPSKKHLGRWMEVVSSDTPVTDQSTEASSNDSAKGGPPKGETI